MKFVISLLLPSLLFVGMAAGCNKNIFEACFGSETDDDSAEAPSSADRESMAICARPAPHMDCIMAGPTKTGYFFDTVSGQCLPFQYRCFNDVFSTLQACQDSCLAEASEEQGQADGPRASIDICERTAPTFDCARAGPTKTGYFFDSASGECAPFQYRCINDVFQSQTSCQSRCMKTKMPNPLSPVEDEDDGSRASIDICERTAPTFDCMMAGPTKTGYFFDSASGECTSFQYRCINDVFTSQASCQTRCTPPPPPVGATEGEDDGPRASIDICERTVPTFDCDMAGPTETGYFFDSASGQCAPFQYRCINDVFTSQASCETRCMQPQPPVDRSTIDICQRPVPGHDCLMAGPKKTGFFFDTSSDECKPFQYMCVNDVFLNRTSCEKTCMEQGVEEITAEMELPAEQRSGQATSICELPKITGRCKAAYRRFYYDASTGRCLRFIYGGCDGNANNFESLSECQRACVTSSEAAV